MKREVIGSLQDDNGRLQAGGASFEGTHDQEAWVPQGTLDRKESCKREPLRLEVLTLAAFQGKDRDVPSLGGTGTGSGMGNTAVPYPAGTYSRPLRND